MKSLKTKPRPRIGLYSYGLRAYWDQFEGLKDRLVGYNKFIEDKLAQWSDVVNYGLVDCSNEAISAGDFFNSNNVDLIFAHSATYATSDSILPIHQKCKTPVVVLNLQPAARINYDKTTTGEWLAHCGACPVPEVSNAFERAGIKFRFISGMLGLESTPEISLTDENTHDRKEAKRAWKEIEEYVQAASVKHVLQKSNFGFLGNYYSGMLDMYSDFTQLQAAVGINIKIIEMCDLEEQLKLVTDEEVLNKRNEIESMFVISGDSTADPIARKPTEDQLNWSCKVAAAQERLVRKFDIDALTYYYHGSAGGYYEQIQSGFIVGHSLLTAKGIPCAGEADIKTNLAMKICDILDLGGSYCEIVVPDYEEGTLLLGHDGPFHISIAEGKPILRGMGLYHGKQGTGVSVEAKVKKGPITTLGVTQLANGKLKLIISEAESTDGPIMQIGNTQTPVRFSTDIDSYMEKWFQESPTHHFAMSVGHNASLFKKTAELLGIDSVVV